MEKSTPLPRIYEQGHGEDREVSVTRSEMEKRGLSNYIITWDGPDIPKVWVGDDVHSFWSGYGGVPRTGCHAHSWCSDFNEVLNNCPAPKYDPNTKKEIVCPCNCGDIECEEKNKCLRRFTNLHSLEQNAADDYDLTAKVFGGNWGGWGKDKEGEGPDRCPHGPTGSESDRDYYGNYDNREE
jgi:hypothetical protein